MGSLQHLKWTVEYSVGDLRHSERRCRLQLAHRRPVYSGHFRCVCCGQHRPSPSISPSPAAPRRQIDGSPLRNFPSLDDNSPALPPSPILGHRPSLPAKVAMSALYVLTSARAMVLTGNSWLMQELNVVDVLLIPVL